MGKSFSTVYKWAVRCTLFVAPVRFRPLVVGVGVELEVRY